MGHQEFFCQRSGTVIVSRERDRTIAVLLESGRWILLDCISSDELVRLLEWISQEGNFVVNCTGLVNSVVERF